jgi:hypothetical protein
MKDKDSKLLEEAYVTYHDDFLYRKLKEKVQNVDYDNGLKLIWQWAKEGRINLKVFKALIEDNRNSTY